MQMRRQAQKNKREAETLTNDMSPIYQGKFKKMQIGRTPDQRSEQGKRGPKTISWTSLRLLQVSLS